MSSAQSLDSAELTASVTAMAKVGGCWSPSFSPDGKSLAFVSNLSGLPQVWKVSVDGGWPELVTALSDQIVLVKWSPDGNWLAFRLAPGGGMNEQVYIVHPDGTGLKRLTPGGKETNWLDLWNHDGSKLAYASNLRDPDAMDACWIDMATGESQVIVKNRGIGTLTDISRDNRYAIAYRQENRSSTDLFLVDIASGAETCLTTHSGPGNFDNGLFSPDGKTIYLMTDLDTDLIAFGRIAVDTNGKPGAIEVLRQRDDAGVDGFVLSHDGRTAVIAWNVAGRTELELLDLTTLQRIAAPALPVEMIFPTEFSPDDAKLMLVATGSNAPRDIWIYDLKSQAMTQITHSPHPSIPLDQLIKPELVHFKAHDGLELSAWLYRPHNFQAPGPIVLSFHGGPEGQERPYFDGTYQALLAQGIAILAPNVRGSGGFGKTFVNLDNGPLRVNGVLDIKACVDYVVSQGITSVGHIGIMGGSYGGYMTMAGLTEFPDLFAAGCNLFGVVNFRTFFAHTEPWMAAISKIEYGDPDTQGEMLDALSPINKIDKVIAPTLVLHGANDTNVPVVEAEQVVDNLKQRGIPVDYILFPDEGHGFRKEPNRITAAVATVRWFVQYL